MDSLNWVFELVDKISAPAATATASLGKLTDGINEAAGAYRSLEAAAAGAGRSMKLPGGSGGGVGGGGLGGGGLGPMLDWLGAALGPAAIAAVAVEAGFDAMKMGLDLAVDGVKAFASAVLAFSEKVVSTANEKQTLRMGLELMLGDKDIAKQTTQRIRDLADTTPFEQKDIATPARGLIGSGYGVDRAFDVVNALGDVAAINNFDAGSLERMALSMQKLEGSGKLAVVNLSQLEKNSGGLIGRAKIFKELADEAGKTPQEIQAAIRQGKITADQGTQAILEVIRKNFSGGVLGGGMKRFGREIGGLMSTMHDMFETLVPEVDDSPGLRSFRGVLRSLVDGFMSQKPALTHAMASLINAIFGGAFGTIEDGNYDQFFRDLFAGIAVGAEQVAAVISVVFDAAEATMIGFLDGIIAIRPVVMTAWDAMRQSLGDTDWSGALAAAGEILGIVAGLLATAAIEAARFALAIRDAHQALGEIFSPDSGPSQMAALSGQVIGGNISQGLADGIQANKGSVLDSLRGLVTDSIGVVSGGFMIKSPSRIMMGLGGYVSEGFALGIDSGAGQVDAAMGSLVGAPQAALGGLGGLGSAGGGIIVTIGEIVVNGGGDPEETAKIVRDVAIEQIAEGIWQQAITMGLAAA